MNVQNEDNKPLHDDRQLMATSISAMESSNAASTIHGNIPSFAKASLLPSDLVAKLAGDVIVACGVTLGIAPFMSIIDKSIVQNAAGTHTIVQSCAESISTIFRNPVSFVKSPMFLMMWGVYAATYSSVNCLKTIVEHQETRNNDSASISSTGKFGVFAMTTAVNSTTTMMKDNFYARQFGTTTAKMPLITYGLWGLRDCMVIGSSFILPEYMSNTLQQNSDLDKKTALQISQLTCPIATQLVAGPIQLLGLDFYNRPLSDLSYKAAVLERLKFQYANFTSIVGARIARIAPAYGIGGVGNTHFRDMWRDYLQERDLNGLVESKAKLHL
jgi:hypothetical protein